MDRSYTNFSLYPNLKHATRGLGTVGRATLSGPLLKSSHALSEIWLWTGWTGWTGQNRQFVKNTVEKAKITRRRRTTTTQLTTR